MCPILDAHTLPTGHLCKEWAPDAFVVSFKLETDEDLLIPKAVGALNTYGVHAVVRFSLLVCAGWRLRC
jgi:hypothetical protein